MRDFLHDAWRMAALFLVGIVVLKVSEPLSRLVGEPALYNYGTLAAFVLMGLAVCHVARRVLFPRVGLSQLAAKADPGHVFVGVCIVLAAIILCMRPVQAAELPPGAVVYIPTLKAQQLTVFIQDYSKYDILQIEHETNRSKIVTAVCGDNHHAYIHCVQCDVLGKRKAVYRLYQGHALAKKEQSPYRGKARQGWQVHGCAQDKSSGVCVGDRA